MSPSAVKYHCSSAFLKWYNPKCVKEKHRYRVSWQHFISSQHLKTKFPSVWFLLHSTCALSIIDWTGTCWMEWLIFFTDFEILLIRGWGGENNISFIVEFFSFSSMDFRKTVYNLQNWFRSSRGEKVYSIW